MSRMITQSTLTVGGIDLKTPPLPNPVPRVTLGKPPSRMTVACVWWGDLYPVKYVEILRDAVARHLTIPHDFVCLTPHAKVPEGVIKMTPKRSDAGWWQKINLFDPEMFGPSSRVLYLDLDLVVTGCLYDIACAQEPFCMIENFGPNKGHAAHNSSVMLWTPSEKTHRVYDAFCADSSRIIKGLHGDQCFSWRAMHPDIWNWEQNQIVSYKYEKHHQWRHQDQHTAVVVFHGQPKPHQVKDPEIMANWR